MEFNITILNPVVLCICIVILSTILLAKSLFQNNQSKRKYHPVAGTNVNLILNVNRLHHYVTELSAKYNMTFRISGITKSHIFTADPANVEYILKTNFDNYGKGWANYIVLKDLLGDGIFAVDGYQWRQQRKYSSHEFSSKVLKNFSSEVFRNNAAKLGTIVYGAADSNQPFDIQDLFMKSTLDSIFKVAFGVDLDIMCGTSEEGSIFCKAFDDSSATTLRRYLDPLWKIKKYMNIGSEAALKRNINVLDDFVYKLIHLKTEQMRTSLADGSSIKTADLLSRFLQLPDANSPKYLRDIILNFIIAGKDSTAATLSWFIYMLCKHPAIQEKVTREVKAATTAHGKGKFTFSEFTERISDEALDNMQYLHATLTETLRLHPAVPVDTKMCFSDDTLPDGFSLKQGNLISYTPYAMGRMKPLWGNDAEDFRPERWLDQNGNFKSENPFKFTAFQAGPRICLGKEFAYRQMKIISAALLGHFRLKLHDSKRAVNYKTMINLHIDGGLHYLPSSTRGRRPMILLNILLQKLNYSTNKSCKYYLFNIMINKHNSLFY